MWDFYSDINNPNATTKVALTAPAASVGTLFGAYLKPKLDHDLLLYRIDPPGVKRMESQAQFTCAYQHPAQPSNCPSISNMKAVAKLVGGLPKYWIYADLPNTIGSHFQYKGSKTTLKTPKAGGLYNINSVTNPSWYKPGHKVSTTWDLYYCPKWNR